MVVKHHGLSIYRLSFSLLYTQRDNKTQILQYMLYNRVKRITALVIVSCPVLSRYYHYCCQEVRGVAVAAEQTGPPVAACFHKVLGCFSASLEPPEPR